MDKLLNIADKLDNQCLIGIVTTIIAMSFIIKHAFNHSENIAKIFIEVKK
jgi:hypothetical protein